MSLGTDVTRVQAALVNQPNSANPAEQKLVNVDTVTQFLVAAGAAAFDPNCKSPGIAQALAAKCSVLGTFQSTCGSTSGTGCGMNPQQEQLWANANGGYFASYPNSQWFPGTIEVWSRLRGTLTNMIHADATGDAGDTMALLSNPDFFYNKGVYAVPFQMTDRPYWILHGTATALLQQIMMGTVEISVNNFAKTWVESVLLGCPLGLPDCDGRWGPYWAFNGQSPKSTDSTTKMRFMPNITFPGAQCFAAHNPTQNNGPGTVGRGSGTSGALLWRLSVSLLCDRGTFSCNIALRKMTPMFHGLRPLFPSPLFNAPLIRGHRSLLVSRRSWLVTLKHACKPIAMAHTYC